MITGPVYTTFEDAYLAVLREIRQAPQYETETRAKTAIETTNVSLTIRNPVARTPHIAARKANVVFNHAEALWYLTGRDDLDMIAHYAPNLRRLSEDGETLTGTAYGPRLFKPTKPDDRCQFDRVIELLRRDPDAKRATMLIMQPDELVDPDNPDVACTLGLQLMLRGGQLHMSAYMRGNDAMIGLLGDVFAFTLIQEFAARQLGVEVGSYAHHVGSMHINVNDLPKVDRMLAERTRPAFPAEQMPATTWTDLAEVATWEERLRKDAAVFGPDDAAGLKPYWAQVIALFEVYRQVVYRADQPVSPEALAMLRPGHRWLIEQRWPTRVPQAVAS
ncbi:thymidylate synthase [Micromonospora aurantiaca]|uniref:thymidylate synthase n=1 Tax=Micromonospora aurantiaca (nom. illeg.) TaxID=47850 RepID=UPI000F41D3DB|nr:thymidylate synthase [Micromonospora aurantiaca]RNI00944.1 thymidylate synthase [Micromonospora aurantiaca]